MEGSRYAGLRDRVGAFALDYVAVILPYVAVVIGLGAAARVTIPDVARTLFSNALIGQVSGFLLITLPVSLYFALSEASRRQSTWGKGRLGLRVVRDHGGRLELVRSLARTALKFLPWELSHTLIWQFAFAGPEPPPALTVGLVVVWVLVGANLASVFVDPRRRALYDRVAGTVVVRGPVMPHQAPPSEEGAQRERTART